MWNYKIKPGLKAFSWLIVFFGYLLSFNQSLASDFIGPDDALRITVYGYDDLKTETRVSADGRITFPLIGELSVKDMSAIKLEENIASRLKQGGFIHDPHVTVAIMENISKQVSVLGYVNKPGRYPLNSDSSIVDLIAMAGGSNDLADNKIVITRTTEGKSQKIELDLRNYLENKDVTNAFKMQQGDSVYVPKAAIFYIYGDVQKPGSYRLDPDLTVVKALSIAGGLTLRGSEDRIHIKRKSQSGELLEVDADLGSPIEKDDVIFVNERWF